MLQHMQCGAPTPALVRGYTKTDAIVGEWSADFRPSGPSADTSVVPRWHTPSTHHTLVLQGREVSPVSYS
jgi:hypothetical protein